MALAIPIRSLTTSRIEGSHKRRAILGAALVCFVSLLFAALVLAVDVGAVAVLAVLVGLIAIGTKPRYGLYVLFAAVLFFEVGGEDPLMLPGRYLFASLQTTLRLSGGILIPFEMVLLLTSTIWIAHAAMRQRIDFRGGFLGKLVLIFAGFLVLGLLRGVVGGGLFNYSIWESRFLFAMVLAYVVTANTIRTRAHVRTLNGIVMVGVSLSVLEGLWRKYALINGGLITGAPETWFQHDVVVVWGMLIVLTLATHVFGGPRWQRWLGPIMSILTLVVLLESERRSGIIAVMIGFTVFTIALLSVKRKAFLLIAVPAALVAAIYLPLFWNNTGTLGQGARAVRSISSPDPRDAQSNAWRDLEAINVRATIAAEPVFGVGFGRPFLQIVAVPDISFFEFWNYEAHHNVLWVWMKTGAFGFIAFFTLMLVGMARAIWIAKSTPHPEVKTLALVGMASIAMSLVFCYVDLGLTGNRIPMVLGVALGSIGILDRIRE